MENINLKKWYCLIKKDDGIYLKVDANDKVSFGVTETDIISHLQMERIPFDSNIISNCFQSADGKERKISANVQGVIHRSYLKVVVSPDKMNAYLQVIPFLGGKSLSAKDIKSFLQEKGIRFGIIENVFSLILKKQEEYNEYLIAEGKNSEKGEDAKLIYKFNIDGLKIKPKELDDGSVDFYNLNLIQVVESGTVLVEKQFPTRGEKGMNIFGEEISALPGKDVRLPLGKNTQAIDEYSKLIATREGHVVLVNGKVNVLNSYTIESDVDFNTGNISFPGNLLIKGHVKNSFKVEAEGDIEIYGNVEGTVISKSNVYIKKGIIRGTVIADGGIFVRYIENGNAQCGTEMLVNEAIMHSTVKAGKKVTLGGRKGLIVGGKCIAGEEIYAKNIGSLMGTNTTLEVGISPELRIEYQEITKKLIKLKQERDKNQKIIKALQSIKEKKGDLPADKKDIFLKVSRLVYQNKYEIECISNRIIELDAQFEVMKKAKIVAEKSIYGGVNVNIGKYVFNNIEEKNSVCFILDGFDIKYYPLVERR